uniref:Adenylyl cyclase-associated protein 2 n=1 Tax=Aceria tosichella TaxID=561515 RepID=A0A6G1SGA1_9ACAR
MDQVKDSFEVFLQKSQQIGDVVQEMAHLVRDAVQSHWQVVDLASKVKKPSQEDLNNILKSTGSLISKVEEFKQNNRAHTLFNHLASVSESIPALGWVAVSPTPAPYVKEMIDAAQFYTNKVLVAYKDKNKLHVEWAQSWLEFLKNLHTYIRQVHTTGLVWNAKGDDFKPNQSTSAAPPPPPPMSGMPPPPPPPPASTAMQVDGDANARAALLRELNQGTDITKNLKKVNKDDRSLLTPMSERSSRSKSPDPRSTPAMNRVPKFELEGRKWALEYHTGNTQEQFTIQSTEMSQSVNIYRCERIMVIVQGKVNSITVDSCKKLSLVFDDIVSVVEFINCQSIQAQPMSKVPTITIDKTDGFQLFLRKESLDVELISAKSAEINICVIDEKTGDYKEHAIPEQLKTTWKGNQFKTEAMDKA